jgi:hypothetical protein
LIAALRAVALTQRRLVIDFDQIVESPRLSRVRSGTHNAGWVVTMSFKQLIPLAVAFFFFLAATYPRPILVKILRDRNSHQLAARFCLAILGILALWGWCRIEG